jgi:hypothetical protein
VNPGLATKLCDAIRRGLGFNPQVWAWKTKTGKEEQTRRLEMALGWSCFIEIDQAVALSSEHWNYFAAWVYK